MYRVLLRAYPRRFRDRFGTEMLATWEERRGERGSAALMWLSTCVDVVANGLAERLRMAKEDTMDSLSPSSSIRRSSA